MNKKIKGKQKLKPVEKISCRGKILVKTLKQLQSVMGLLYFSYNVVLPRRAFSGRLSYYSIWNKKEVL